MDRVRAPGRVVVAVVLAVAAASAACSSRSEPPAASPSSGPATATASAEFTGTPEPTKSATNTSTPVPTATETPAAAPTATVRPLPATATPAAAGVLIEHGRRDSNMVALTFDMGGRVDPALDIMNWLITNRVAATVFMTGAMVENRNTDAGRQVLRLIDAHRELFDLGNHSYSHPDFRSLSSTEMSDELSRTEAAIAGYTSVSPRPLFRPPFGGQNGNVVSSVARVGYSRTIMWDVDTIDWKPESEGGPTAAAIVEKAASGVQGGSIVLMHLGGYHTFEALPAIVSGLRARGLEPVTLGTMFGD